MTLDLKARNQRINSLIGHLWGIYTCDDREEGLKVNRVWDALVNFEAETIAAYLASAKPAGEVVKAPELLTEEERKSLLKDAEMLWADLQKNNLGGLSDGNRPFHIMYEFKHVIERYGRRDVGLNWSTTALEALSRQGSAEPATETCERCQGNGEIVTDWDRYKDPRPGDVGDEAVAECPDCNGEGHVAVPPAHRTPGDVAVKPLEWEDREEKRLGGRTDKFWRAQTAFDWGYRVFLAYGRYNVQGLAGDHTSLDEAKAAAQADYEARIRSALGLAPGEDR